MSELTTGPKYVPCDDCGRTMDPGTSCTIAKLVPMLEPVDRIPYGDPREGGFSENSEFCHDCNAGVGQFHHVGCDVERCPTCLRQLISCGHTFIPWKVAGA